MLQDNDVLPLPPLPLNANILTTIHIVAKGRSPKNMGHLKSFEQTNNAVIYVAKTVNRLFEPSFVQLNLWRTQTHGRNCRDPIEINESQNLT